MKSIAEIDKNFAIKNEYGKEDIVFYNALDEKFKIYGLIYENNQFRRIPGSVAKTVNDGVVMSHKACTGGRIRFKTNSPYIVLNAKMWVARMVTQTLAASASFDLYVRKNGKEVYTHTFRPEIDDNDNYKSMVDFGSKKMRDITIYFPLFSEVHELSIGISNKAVIEARKEYKTKTPFVFYGSSITQGGCASRPGTCYPAIVSREFDADYINLGFSGSAHGEQTIMDYIKSLDMSVFIYDYDHNANVERLRETHENGFKTIREEHPDLPVLILSRPDYIPSKDTKERLKIIKKTYENAIACGDKNVYLITGRELMRLAKNEGTVDGCHLTDLGFTSMAKAVIKTVKSFIK